MKSKIIALSTTAIATFWVSILIESDTLFHPEFNKNYTTASIGISTTNFYPTAVGLLTNSTSCLRLKNQYQETL